jgi:hypothetical protein
MQFDIRLRSRIACKGMPLGKFAGQINTSREKAYLLRSAANEMKVRQLYMVVWRRSLLPSVWCISHNVQTDAKKAKESPNFYDLGIPTFRCIHYLDNSRSQKQSRR